jgi:hypothetical protein
MTSTSRYQRLGDLVCGTMVIVEARRWLDNATLVNDPRAIELAEALPANYEVRRELGMALAQYVSRRERFSAGRRADIARFVGAPLVERFNLPQDTSHDLLLCALYYKTFVADFPGMSAAARRPQPDRFEIVTR